MTENDHEMWGFGLPRVTRYRGRSRPRTLKLTAPSVKLIAQALSRTAFARDWGQIQLVHEAAEGRAEVELGALGS